MIGLKPNLSADQLRVARALFYRTRCCPCEFSFVISCPCPEKHLQHTQFDMRCRSCGAVVRFDRDGLNTFMQENPQWLR